MAYTPTAWTTGDVVTEAGLDNLEAGVDSAHDDIAALDSRLDVVEPRIVPTIAGNDGKWLKVASGAMLWDAIDIAEVTGLQAALDAKLSSVPDATASVKGIVQLAGDLAGTAASPQIAASAITHTEIAAANKDGAAATPSLRTLGAGSTQAAAGNDSRLSDSRAPSGTASGDLSGSYPSPQIAAGVIVNADINASAAIVKSKLAALGIVDADVAAGAAIAEAKLSLATDAAAGTGSRRTLGTGALQAAAGNDSRFAALQTGLDAKVDEDAVVVAGTRLVASKLLAGDAQPAFRISGDGRIEWGPGGASTPDTSLYRSEAMTLKTGGTLKTGSSIIVDVGANQIVLANDGKLYFGDAYDTNLYRYAANFLATDDQFYVNIGQAGQIALAGNGTIYFGAAGDTNLYRVGAGQLRSDGNITAGSSLSVGGPIYLGLDGLCELYRNAGGQLVYRGSANTVTVIAEA